MLKDELCVGAVEGQLLVLMGSPIEGEWVVAKVDPALLNVQEHQSYLHQGGFMKCFCWQ